MSTDRTRSPRIVARARRAGLVVRSGDLSTFLGLSALLAFATVWGGALWTGLMRAVRTGLTGAVDPRRAHAELGVLAHELSQTVGVLFGLLLLASLLSLLLQTTTAGRPSLRVGGGGLRLLGPASPLSPAGRLEGLWTVFKAAMVLLVLAGLAHEAAPAAVGLLGAAPSDVPALVDLYAGLVQAWLLRLALLAVPIVVLDVVIQRFRHRSLVAALSPSDRDLRRQDEGDPYVRARLRQAARARDAAGATPARGFE